MVAAALALSLIAQPELFRPPMSIWDPIEVAASRSTSLTVQEGALIEWEAEGEIEWYRRGEVVRSSGPDGDLSPEERPAFSLERGIFAYLSPPYSQEKDGALVGVIEDQMLFAGGYGQVAAPRAGTLSLRINDAWEADNKGAFWVTLRPLHAITVLVDLETENGIPGHVFVALRSRDYDQVWGFYPESGYKDDPELLSEAGDLRDDSRLPWSSQKTYAVTEESFQRALEVVGRYQDSSTRPRWSLFGPHCGYFAKEILDAAGLPVEPFLAGGSPLRLSPWDYHIRFRTGWGDLNQFRPEPNQQKSNLPSSIGE